MQLTLHVVQAPKANFDLNSAFPPPQYYPPEIITTLVLI